MNTFFSNKCISLLIRGTISLLILSTMVVAFISAPLVTHAQMSQTQSDIKQAFKDFCFFYYNDGQNSDADQDTQVCQKLSSRFSSLLKQIAPKGSKQWPAKYSLHDLARKDLLKDKKTKTLIESPQDFVDSIANSDLRALVSGSGNSDKKIPQDSAFLPTLWDYNSTLDTITNRYKPVTIDKIPLSDLSTDPYEPVLTDINPSSTGSKSNRDVYQKALNVFCHMFQNDVTAYLYGSTTPENLASMLSALRTSRSVSKLAQAKDAGITIPFADVFERGEIRAAQEALNSNPDNLSRCPGAQQLSQAKPVIDDFVKNKMSNLTASELDSYFSKAVLFGSRARIQ